MLPQQFDTLSAPWPFACATGFLILLSSPLMTSALTCNATLALACTDSSELTASLLLGNISEATVLQACSVTAREDRCFNESVRDCNASMAASLRAQWQQHKSDSRHICEGECSSYRDVVRCAMQASATNPSESHPQFCRVFEESVECSGNFSTTCNISRHLFEALVGAYYVHQFFAFCHSDVYVEQSEGCRPDQVVACLAQLRHQVDDFLYAYHNQSHQPQQLVHACTIALEEDNTTECYHMVMRECANSSVPQPAELMYQDLLEETLQVCEAECNGFHSLKTCFSQVRFDAMETDLVTFCRSYSEGLDCALSSTSGCNVSSHLFHSLAGERASHVYGVFCLQGGMPMPVSESCNPSESERCFLALQENFDNFLSSYIMSNHTRQQVSHICTAIMEGNELTRCFHKATETCTLPEQNPATLQFRELMDDISHICQTECPDLAGVRGCQQRVNFSLLECPGGCSDFKPFCRSLENTRQCLAQLNCRVAQDILNEMMPQKAHTAENTHCKGESCFDDELLTALDPSGGRTLDKAVCLRFLRAFSCSLQECSERGLSHCTSKLEPRIQRAITASLSRCERTLKEVKTGTAAAAPLGNRVLHVLSAVLASVLCLLRL